MQLKTVDPSDVKEPEMALVQKSISEKPVKTLADAYGDKDMKTINITHNNLMQNVVDNILPAEADESQIIRRKKEDVNREKITGDANTSELNVDTTPTANALRGEDSLSIEANESTSGDGQVLHSCEEDSPEHAYAQNGVKVLRENDRKTEEEKNELDGNPMVKSQPIRKDSLTDKESPTDLCNRASTDMQSSLSDNEDKSTYTDETSTSIQHEKVSDEECEADTESKMCNDETLPTLSNNREMMECQNNMQLKTADPSDVKEPEMTLIQKSISEKPVKTLADAYGDKDMETINITHNNLMQNEVDNILPAEADESQIIRRKKEDMNREKITGDANTSELNVDTTPTANALRGEDSLSIEANESTSGDGQVLHSCEEDSPEHAYAQNGVKVLREYDRKTEEEEKNELDGNPMVKSQPIRKDSLTDKESPTDLCNRTSTDMQSSLSDNEDRSTYTEETSTSIQHENVSDEECEADTESKCELSRSDEDLLNDGGATAAPGQTHYKGKHKNKKNKERKKRIKEERRVFAKSGNSTDLNGNMAYSQHPLSQNDADSEQNEMVFGPGKDLKNQENKSQQDSTSSSGRLFETQAAEPHSSAQSAKQSDETDEPKQTPSEKKESNHQDNASRKQESSTPPKKVRVIFHGLISDEFVFVIGKHKLILRICDNWEDKTRECNVQRNKGDLFEFKYSIELPVSISRMQYKYSIFKPDGNYDLEYYTSSTERKGNRVMLNMWKESDEWHQYDGIIRKQKGVLEKFTNYVIRPDLINHAKLCADHFGSRIIQGEDNLPCYDDVLEQLNVLFSCLRKIYFLDARSWGSKDNSAFVREVGFSVLGSLINTIKKPDKNDGAVWSDIHEQKVKAAISVILFVHKAGELNIYKTDVWNPICEVLLFRPNATDRMCQELKVVENYFNRKKKQVLDAFQSLACSIAKSTTDPSWLFLMPWIHFLSEWCTPFQDPPCDVCHDSKEPLWWGLNGVLKNAVSCFKTKKGNWTVPMEDILKRLKPSFKADYLLPRTFLAAVPLQNISMVNKHGTIPAEVYLANVIYFLKTNKDDKKVRDYLQTVTSTLQKDGTSYTGVQRKLQCLISEQLVNECIKTDQETLFVCGFRTLLRCLSQYDANSADSADDHRQFIMDKLQPLADKAVCWIQQCKSFPQRVRQSHFQVWNSIFIKQDGSSNYVMTAWNSRISCALADNLQRHYQENKSWVTETMQLCFETYDSYCSCMQECLSTTTFQVLDGGAAVSHGKFSEGALNKIKHLLSGLFIKEWTQHEDTFKSESEMIHHFLQWPIFMLFLKTYKREDFTTTESSVKITQVVSVVQMFTSSLLSGEITVGQLKSIQQTHNSFPEAAALVPIDDTCTAVYITKAIAVRQKQVDAFNAQLDLVKMLMNLSEYLENVDRTVVDEVLENAHDISVLRISDICSTANITDVEDCNKFQPTVSAFQLSDAVFDMLPNLSVRYDSTIFMKMWEKQCRLQTNECFTFDDVEEKVWHPVNECLESLSDHIRIGSIKFSEFEKLFGRPYDVNHEYLTKEMDILDVSQKITALRVGQLQQYRQLENSVHGAKTIYRFARQYELTGDFKKIQTIAKHVEHDPEMRDFDSSIMKTCGILKDISKDKEECLTTFLNCQPLIKWLKTTMKMGLKELKVFVDLAFIAVGEEQILIDQVQCFHSSVTGYAPLIFDLKPESGYKQLLELCQNVWNALQANPYLSLQLERTHQKLKWLTEIEKSLGSVELTSLMQAEAINSAGIYNVGRHAFHSESLHLAQLDVQSIVRLTVPEGQENTHNKVYSVPQLQDLQSRLMLVAGKSGKQQDEKGNDAVERFTMIFDSITRLAKVYLQLCVSGCVLFNDFTATFFCHPTLARCAVLEFGHNETAPQLKGRLSDEEDIQDLIPELASFLDTCLKEWLHNIKEKRQSYPHLNYFTVDQLVILQRELVKLGPEEEPSCRIYPLLSAVKMDCTRADLVQAIEAAREEIEPEAVVNDEQDNEDLAPNADETDVEDGNQTQTFITELVGAGFEHTLAIQALQYVDPSDVDEGIVWCMNYGKYDNEDTGTDDDETEHKPVVDKWSQSTTDIQSLINTSLLDVKKRKKQLQDNGIAPLMNDLREIWKHFLESITSNISDFINLEHLGIILKHLAAKDTRQLSRNLHPGLREDQPNLILSPCDDVLLTTMSMYLNEKEQPLPQSDEVLLCTSDTTKDEVDIFLRRAIYDGCHKIHCLVNAECLNYDVSEFAERCLEHYVQESHHEGMPFHLVVICGSENECRSTFISSLDKYKRQPLHVNMNTIREKLSRQLTVEHNQDPLIIPAAWVDRDHLSVRVIKSSRPGVGKTLYKRRREEDLVRLNGHNGVVAVSIPLQESNVDMHYVIERFLEHTFEPDEDSARLFHIDMSHVVLHGVDNLLFNLLILGCLTDKTGWVWRKSLMDLYLIETWPLTDSTRQLEKHCVHRMLTILPDTMCKSPVESLHVYMTTQDKRKRNKIQDQLFDEQLFLSEFFQRPFQYLYHLENRYPLDDIYKHAPLQPVGNPEACLKVLLRHCGVRDPSWLELHHFVWFLNTQLVDFEKSSFTGPVAAEHLPGFSTFVLRFIIQMSKDFATRSLNMSEESPGHQNIDVAGSAEVENVEGAEDENADMLNELKPYQIRRTWESSPHPYLFFNSDRSTFTFLGFYIERGTGNLMDTQTGTVLVKRIIDQKLSKALYDNKVPLTENFDNLPRNVKIMKLCSVMGIDLPHDPDASYELTTDNVKKMLAIYMRFRCNIPVIIMGETGCGKTRLIKFMCALQVPLGADVNNMVLMKVHGGTTKSDVERIVRHADKKARANGKHMYTVLFFDEANTSDAIGLIKEIMCDKTLSGHKLHLCESLKIVAACNPYRKHSSELIKKLEQAGLGYHVDADNTTDRLGRVPMRRLVYRVQPLPHSLLPLVWDFGQLNAKVENLYIKQMVRRFIQTDELPDMPYLVEVVSSVLSASQAFMRGYNNECSFVSLRDIDRVLSVMSWFYQQSRGQRTLYNLMDEKRYGGNADSSSDDDEECCVNAPQIAPVNDVTRSLILALGVCYLACLRSRAEYRAFIARYFDGPYRLQDGEDQIESEIECCQDVFLKKLELDKNIARNMALKENVFMMVVCIELRIPLFLVGKPGSSKSLAKTIVSDVMQGNAQNSPDLFRQFKQAQMVSFQCSPLSTPDGIVGTFRQCALLQKGKDLNNYVSVVVLDEVGLAEDSPRMPLKTLHPLLEDGCQGNETSEAHKKVAFVGISNWALDPAKMNRGILVQRNVPDLEELVKSASGMCQVNKKKIDMKMKPLIEPMAKAYLELFEKASQEMREFFGLRDFYSLVKMVCGFVQKSKKRPTWYEMLHAIKRNFGGLDNVDSESFFKKHLAKVVPVQNKRNSTDPVCSPGGLIRACLFDTNKLMSESRYLLLLTENYGALDIMQQIIRIRHRDFRPITIFGSSFRRDQEYTQVCRNINKIKVCMETGNTVVLLNLENLYESLYDALNQYYTYCFGKRYVDLGLGTHRVKCPVDEGFRLIVVAEKNTVYKKFPIPLINRLEKHFLSINTLLTEGKLCMVDVMKTWTEQFCSRENVHIMPPQRRGKDVKARVSETFIGYNDDTCSAVVFHVCKKHDSNNPEIYKKVLNDAKMVLLWCATPDSIAKLKFTLLSADEQEFLNDTYFRTQAHGSLIEYLHQKLVQENNDAPLFAQITTHFKLMASVNKEDISKATGIPVQDILFLESLSSFDTEQQFSIRIRHFLQHAANGQGLMVIQCDSGDINANLVACARYCVMDEIEKMREDLAAHIHVVFIVQLSRQSTFSGFQCGLWHSVHIDDLYPEEEGMPKMAQMIGKSVATLVSDVVSKEQLASADNGMCQVNKKKIDMKMKPLIEPMAKAYLELFEKASQEMREFFGLRDFYSLVKMVCGFVQKSKKRPTWYEMLHAIKRNFGGLDNVDSESFFKKHLAKVVPVQNKRNSTDPVCSPGGLIRACLFDTNKLMSESRYLLLLTENYGALDIMQQIIRIRHRDFRPITIFGSSFRRDQEYTQVCRNINKIKVCMETGNTVVLLNLENLYESLYDALNQYYTYCFGKRYVDLGLGTHRVKCPVDEGFRLIVVAEKNTVYKKFPIPLINRLEKHFLSINTLLTEGKLCMVDVMKTWTEQFCSRENVHIMPPQRRGKDVKARVSETFIGYNDDTCSAVVFHVCKKHDSNNPEIYKKVLNDAKMVLLWCATPDSIAKLKFTLLSADEQEFLNDTYFRTQAHGSLIEYLHQKLVQENNDAPLFAQITTHFKLMASVNKEDISKATGIPVQDILFLESLSSFDTEQQFSIRIRHFLQHAANGQGLMVIQCDSGDINANLVACARYCVMDEIEKMREDLAAHIHVVFIVQLSRQSTFSGFQCGLWHSVHIDDLYPEEEGMPKMAQMIGKSVATLVSDVVSKEQLASADNGMCQVNKKKIDMKMKPLIEPMAKAYLELFEKASQEMREFFGLRDFYSLVKMVCGFVQKSKKRPTWYEMLHAIKRNFGGLDNVDSESFFKKHLAKVVPVQNKRNSTDPVCSPGGLIRACLFDTNKLMSESRYLLLLTENYGALDIMQQIIRIRHRDFRPITIFGSSFRRDQEYTQVCRNINKIKVCMETGNTVVLLNLENLYESLYDALNQYYTYCFGKRYVDLGLGTHRVKCPVDEGFRLIVVAEKNTVYKKFPIPLINRLEKHFLSINTLLTEGKLCMVDVMKTWTEQFCSRENVHIMPPQRRGKDVKARVSETFIGYNDDTCSAVVFHVCKKHDSNNPEIYKKVLNDAKMVLLWCATPDSIAKLKFTLLSADEQEFLNDTYFRTQAHGSLIEYLHQKLVQENNDAPLFAQITTHFKLMASVNKEDISKATGIPVQDILFLESLSSFDTEQQFSIRIRHFLQHAANGQGLMVIQCDSGDINANLVACARYCVMDEIEKMREDLAAHIHVVFIVQLSRQSTFSGFQCGLWHSVHIDDLYPEEEGMPKMAQMIGKSVATLVSDVVSKEQLASADNKQKVETSTCMDEQVRLLTPIQTDINVPYYFHGMIIRSVHAALAIVKDKEENTNRETDRVKLVLKLLHENQDAVHGVCCLLSKLLNEKESKTFNPRAARDWVIKEAATDESLNKTGTFRRSCLQTLQNKVTPILAGIIAFLDTNDNLKLLQDDYIEWKTGLWFAFLLKHEALQLQYSDLQSWTGKSELTEVTIKTTGFENHTFSAKIPFSWIVIEQIKEIFALPNPIVDDESAEDVKQNASENGHIVKVLNNNPIGQLLNRFTDAEIIQAIVQGYAHDFVHTVYHAGSEHELQLVCQSIMNQLSQLAPEGTERTLIHRLVSVHEAHTILAQRLLYFREINKVWHECSSVIIETKGNEPDNFMFKEEEYIFMEQGVGGQTIFRACLCFGQGRKNHNQVLYATVEVTW